MEPDTMRCLTLDEIMAVDDTATEYVDVPEWNGRVKIRSLTHGESLEVTRKATVNGDLVVEKAVVLWLSKALVEPEVTLEGAARLRRKRAGVVQRIANRIVDLSGLTDDVGEKLELSFRDEPEGAVDVDDLP